MTAYDAWAGLERTSLTPRGRQMAVLAGTDMSFDKASDRLMRHCGIRISDQTVRRACEKSGEQAKGYLDSQEAGQTLAQAPGEAELAIDGLFVNTTDGWREMRGIQAGRREPGTPASVRHWSHRKLPKPSARLVQVAIIPAEQAGEQVKALAHRQAWGLGESVSVLADGAAWIWKQARCHLPEHEGVLDVWHLREHLGTTGRALHGDGEPAERWAELQRALIFRHGGTRYLRDHLAPQVRQYQAAEPGSAAAGALRSLLMYLWKHRGRMRYRDRLRRGLPIGSGQIEGVCKNTLKERLCKNSPRWCPPNANRMAALRCLQTSQAWDSFWNRAA